MSMETLPDRAQNPPDDDLSEGICDMCLELFLFDPDDYDDGHEYNEPDLCPVCQQRVNELENYFETRTRRSDENP